MYNSTTGPQKPDNGVQHSSVFFPGDDNGHEESSWESESRQGPRTKARLSERTPILSPAGQAGLSSSYVQPPSDPHEEARATTRVLTPPLRKILRVPAMFRTSASHHQHRARTRSPRGKHANPGYRALTFSPALSAFESRSPADEDTALVHSHPHSQPVTRTTLHGHSPSTGALPYNNYLIVNESSADVDLIRVDWNRRKQGGSSPLPPHRSDSSEDTSRSNGALFGASQEHMQLALQQCRATFSMPLDYLLMVIGWRPVGYLSQDKPTRCQLVVNILLLLLLFSVLLFSYGYQWAYCQWKLGIDIIKSSTMEPATAMYITSTTSSSSWRPVPTRPHTRSPHMTTPGTEKAPYPACKHIISTYIVPNCLHFVAFVIGFIYFRINCNEDLQALMEKVFQSTSIASQQSLRKRLVTRLKIYLALGAMWVFSALVTHVLYDMSCLMDNESITTVLSRNNWVQITLFVVDMFGHVIGNIVSMATILNYIITCDLIMVYVNSVSEKLGMRSIDIGAARKEVLMIKNTVAHLNGASGIMTSCILAVQVEMLTIGSLILVFTTDTDPWNTGYRYCFVFHLIPTVVYILIQAARVTSSCSRFKKEALRMRTYGYPDSSPEELDSFLLFTMATDFRVKLFHVPVKGSYMMACLVTVFLCILVLSMTGLFQTPVL